MRLCPGACAPSTNTSTDITIGLVLDNLPRRKGVQIAVGPRSGSLVHDPDGPVSRVEVPLDARHLLVVGAPPGKPLSDEELVTFTAGITVSLAGR